MQIVDDQSLQPGRAGEQGSHSDLKRGPPAVAVARNRVTPLGQDTRNVTPHLDRHLRPRACLAALQYRAQQARQGRERHARVARPGGRAHRIRSRFDERLEEPGLAQAGLADDRGQARRLPGVQQHAEFAGAPDQARWPQHAHRQGSGQARSGRSVGSFDVPVQRLGLVVRRHPEQLLECVAAVVEGGQRGGPVAAQIVQAHQAPARVLRRRVDLDQLLCSAQCRCQLAGAFVIRGDACKRIDALGAAALTGRVEPHRETVGIGLDHTGQQLTRAGVGLCQIDLHIFRQAGDRPALQQIEAKPSAQAIQALAQVGVGARLVGVGPQQGSERAPWRRAGDGQIGEQQRVLGLERQHLACAVHAGRLADQAQSRCAARCSGPCLHQLNAVSRPACGAMKQSV